MNELKLVIAEKPSVGEAISRAIGADQKRNGYSREGTSRAGMLACPYGDARRVNSLEGIYLEGNGYLVSWCFGHLVELAMPDEYNRKYAKWRREALPIRNMNLSEGETKPPAHFTEGSLLHAMETAGKGEIPEDAERCGIGTTATRAGIIVRN